MSTIDTTTIRTERLFPRSKPAENAVPLSLLDATTAEFAPTCVVWLCERPDQVQNLPRLFRHSLEVTLNDYLHWTGQLRSIATLSPNELTSQESSFAPHARRYGRVYVHYGTPQDPGVEFVTAQSTATVDTICPASRTTNQPLWDRQTLSLQVLVPSTRVVNPVRPSPPDQTSPLPALAIQLTQLACGGFSVAAKLAHSFGDIQALVHFMKDWSTVLRWTISTSTQPRPVLSPPFNPEQVDEKAAGDINADYPDPAVLEQIEELPLHRYDWFAATPQCPWTQEIPEVFRDQDLPPVGKAMPWSEWDTEAPVSHYLVHLNRKQVESLWQDSVSDSAGDTDGSRISRHDAILAHIWSCIARARQQQADPGLLHCNLTIGARPALQLVNTFIGSPTLMVNIEMTGKELAAPTSLGGQPTRSIAEHIRKTITRVNNPTALAAHLHSIAFEKTPQRIWQAFLGQRHLIVTSWARAGLYEIDFGLSETTIVRYAEGVIPDLDGIVEIREAPPGDKVGGSPQGSWTDHGVDISIQICAEDMERLRRDPLLFP